MIWVTKDQIFFLTHRFHGRRIQLYPPDRCRICASPVKIESAIIILEQVRIPIIHIARYFFIRPMDRILGAIKTTLYIPARCRKIQILTYGTHIRCIVINWHIFWQRITIPMRHVLRDPHRTCHRSKQIIFALKHNHRRICRLPVDCHFIPIPWILFKLISIGYIYRITIYSHLTSTFP